jgi:hypothetical protein
MCKKKTLYVGDTPYYETYRVSNIQGIFMVVGLLAAFIGAIALMIFLR